MAFCTQCGKQLPDNARFCPGCGVATSRSDAGTYTARRAKYAGKINRPVNSSEVISKVEQLQPELDRLILQEFEESVRFDIEQIKAGASSYVDYFRSINERSKFKLTEESTEAAALSSFDNLKKFYADYLNACPMSPAQEQTYIEKRAHNDMHRFGACHRIWNTQKRILKEKYGIQWYTPDEMHPHVHFD